MSARLLDGRALALELRGALVPRAAAVRKAKGAPPRLAVVSAAQDPATRAYRRAQLKACAESGIETEELAFTPTLLGRLGADDAVDALIVDLPVPGMRPGEVFAAVPPAKDAEGVSAENYGRLFLAKSWKEIDGKLIIPCTAAAVAALLRKTGKPLAGKKAVVIGRSDILGKPTAHLLSALDATVTLCHSKTRGLADEVRRADVVVACLGKAGAVKGSWIKKGAVVVDAGINEEGGKLVGDVELSAARNASYLTPVPGGVGPVTTAMLLANVVLLAEKRLA